MTPPPLSSPPSASPTDTSLPPTRHPLHPSIIQFYDSRAAGYDSEPSSAFHTALAHDSIAWVRPYLGLPDRVADGAGSETARRKFKMLDLCCGTGMVSSAAVEALRDEGVDLVIHGVDVSRRSLEIVRRKFATEGAKSSAGSSTVRATFWEGSATELQDIPELEPGSYDLITCCSALVLLPSPHDAVLAHWKDYLKPGGRGVLVFDLPAPETLLASLLFGRAVRPFGVSIVDRDWVQSPAVVGHVMEKAGLSVKRVLETGSYKLGSGEMAEGEWEEKWEKALKVPLHSLEALTLGQREEAKGRFREMWMERVEGGVVKDDIRLIVGIGARKS